MKTTDENEKEKSKINPHVLKIVQIPNEEIIS